MTFRLRRTPEAVLALYGFLASMVWEFAHSALYLDHDGAISYIVWTRIHCAVGDVLILTGSFWWTSLWFRTRFWFTGNGLPPVIVFILSGLAYTVWSEWYNTHVTLAWAYAAAMPTLFGIALSPLAQWIIVPSLLVVVLKRMRSAS